MVHVAYKVMESLLELGLEIGSKVTICETGSIISLHKVINSFVSILPQIPEPYSMLRRLDIYQLILLLSCVVLACGQRYQPTWESLESRPLPSWSISVL
jgi:hypothetical protein